MWTKISDLLPQTINKSGFKKQLIAAQICDSYRKLAPKILGESIAKKTDAKAFSLGVLYLKSDNNIVSQQVFIKQRKLIKEINQKVGTNQLKEVRFSN